MGVDFSQNLQITEPNHCLLETTRHKSDWSMLPRYKATICHWAFCWAFERPLLDSMDRYQTKLIFQVVDKNFKVSTVDQLTSSTICA